MRVVERLLDRLSSKSNYGYLQHEVKCAENLGYVHYVPGFALPFFYLPLNSTK